VRRPTLTGALLILVAAGLASHAAWTAWRGPALRYPQAVGALLASVDLDGDGSLSAQEFLELAPAETPMAIYDLDGDDSLDARELEVAMLAVDPLWMTWLPY